MVPHLQMGAYMMAALAYACMPKWGTCAHVTCAGAQMLVQIGLWCSCDAGGSASVPMHAEEGLLVNGVGLTSYSQDLVANRPQPGTRLWAIGWGPLV